MARPEVYSALKQGVLDGLDNALAFYESMGDYEVAKYLTLGVQLFQTPGALMISDKFLQKLPPDLQKAVIEAGAESIPYQRKVFRDGDSTILDRLKSKGVTAKAGRSEAVLRCRDGGVGQVRRRRRWPRRRSMPWWRPNSPRAPRTMNRRPGILECVRRRTA